MKSKHRNFWSFFWRVGAGFLAFWLVVMAGFTLLLGWQTAQEMQVAMDENLKYFYDDWVTETRRWYEVDAEGRGDLQGWLNSSPIRDRYLEDYVGTTLVETAVLSADDEVLRDDSGWLRAILLDWQERVAAGAEEPTYPVVLDGQSRKVYKAATQWLNREAWERSGAYPAVQIEGWLVDEKLYPKTILVEYRQYPDAESGRRTETVPCVYDTQRFANTKPQTFSVIRADTPGWVNTSYQDMLDSVSNPRRFALREWVTTPHEGVGNYRQQTRPWRVTLNRYLTVQTSLVDEGYVVAQYAAEAYPLKACLPILFPVWGFSFVLAVLFSTILAYALLRVWRKQERVEQARHDTTAALAHELKTPLSVLSATAELLSDDMAKDKRAHYLDVIRQQAQRMDGSVRRMLELSRLEAGAKALRRERFSLSALARERLDAAVPPDSPLHTSVVVDGPDEAEADRALLARALDALLENAVQHTPPDGSITVRIEKGVCAVVNTGEAIPPTALPHLWEPYFQADPARTGQGDGLGLSIAKTVFDLHGYAYGAENTPTGPRFWFRFGKA